MRSSLTFLPILAIAAAGALASPAQAQSPFTPQPQTSAPTGDAARYQALIQNALQEFEAGHYEEARAFFRQAHREIPNPRTLRGIGMASYELRDYVEAYRALSGALNFGPSDRDLTAEHRASAVQLLERTQALIGIVTGVPAFAQVRLDGREHVTEPDGTVLVPLGTHQLAVTLPDGRRGEQRVEVSGGETIAWTAPLAGGGPGTTTTTTTSSLDDERPPPVSHEAVGTTTAPVGGGEPIEPEEPGPPLPRFRMHVLAFVGAGSYQSPTLTTFGTENLYYAAIPVGGAVGALIQVAEIFAVGAQLGGSYASLAENNTYGDTSYWGQTDLLAWGELRFGMLAVGVGLGAVIGFREKSVFEGGWRYIETRADAAFGLAGDVRLYFLDDLLFVAAEGRFAFGDYSAMAGVVAFGVEFLR